MSAEPHPQHMLTNHDLLAFENLAKTRVCAGTWAWVERRQDGRFDLFSIHYPGHRGPMVSVGRRRGGRYVILNHSQGSLRFGRSFAEALGHLPA